MGRLALWQAFGFSCAWTRFFGVFGGVGFCVCGVGPLVLVWVGVFVCVGLGVLCRGLVVRGLVAGFFGGFCGFAWLGYGVLSWVWM